MTARPATLDTKTPLIEYPTLALAIAIYGGFGLVTYFHDSLPWPLLLLLGAYLVAWHSSLQHEVVHGHPTAFPLINRLLVLPNLWLIVPFGVYRDTHLEHHRDDLLTDPLEDPESYYVTAERWREIGPLGRGLLLFNNTLAGRLLVGPFLVTFGCLRSLLGALLELNWRTLASWGANGFGAALVLFWVTQAAGLALWEYLLFFIYPGLSLTLLRSFAEHRAATNPGGRTATLKAEAPLALLFLNNNLHSVHHAMPGLPWYRIPAAWRAMRPEESEAAGESFDGYREIAARYFLKPKEHPLHPSERRDGFLAKTIGRSLDHGS